MKNILKKSDGITLIALITTIIVILILASVATYTGTDILEKSNLAAFTTELKIMQTHVNQLYQKYSDGETVQIASESYTGDEILTMRKNSVDASISTNIENSSLPAYSVAQNVFTSEQSGITDKTGYLYFNKKLIEDLKIEGVKGEFFVNISTRTVLSYEGLKYQNKMYYTLEQLPDSLYNVEYNNSNNGVPTIGNVVMEKVSDDRWRITVSDIQYDGYVQKWKVKYRLETDSNWNSSEDLSFIVNENGKYKIKVVNESIESAESTVGPVITQNVSGKANAPKISTGMIPIKWDSSKRSGKGNWVICTTQDTDWYSYTSADKKWANVMLCDGKYTTVTPREGQVVVDLEDPVTQGGEEIEVSEEDLGSMFVWIPRYAYKITSGYHNVIGSIDVVWLSGTSYYYKDDDENIQIAKNGNSNDGSGNQVTSQNYYVAHPAFTDGSVNQYKYQKENYVNGEWKEEIMGFWVAKFQAGFATTDKDISQRCSAVNNSYYPIFKGRKYAYNYASINQCYSLSLELDKLGNFYGLKENSNSHLMKSSEWGAVTYLSISEFGYSDGIATTDKEKSINNLSLAAYSDVSASPVSNPNDNSLKITAITGYSSSNGKDVTNIMTSEQAEILEDYTKFDEIDNIDNKSYSWNTVIENDNKGTGTKSSTTGNIYGIYDMGGCLADYVASYIKQGNLSNGSVFANNKLSYFSTAYPLWNSNNGIYDFNNNYKSFHSIFGDAIWETSNIISTESNENLEIKGWFNQDLEAGADNNQESFLARGGNFSSGVSSGLIGIADMSGISHYGYGFHSVLIIE